MRTVSKIFRILMWIAVVFYAALQGLAAYGLSLNNANAIAADNKDKVYNILPLMCMALIMVAAVVLFTVLKKKRYIGLCFAIIAAIGMLVVGLDMGRKFPVTVSSTDVDVGLSIGKMIWRHYGIAIVPVFMLVAWLFERSADKSDELYRAMHFKSGYDLSGNAIFSDNEAETKNENKRLKRSMRRRIQNQ